MREWLSAQAASGFVAYDAATRHVHPVARAGRGVRRRGQPRLHDRRLLLAGGRLRRRAEARPRPSRPARASAGASTATACSAASSGSSAPATGRTRRRVAAGARRRGGQARARRQGGRRRLRPWRVDDDHGEGVPELGVRRHRLPRCLDRARAGSSQAASATSASRRRARRTTRARLRPRDHVRCPARHGRSGRRGRACARDAASPTAR